jgi:hypothetical protein
MVSPLLPSPPVIAHQAPFQDADGGPPALTDLVATRTTELSGVNHSAPSTSILHPLAQP